MEPALLHSLAAGLLFLQAHRAPETKRFLLRKLHIHYKVLLIIHPYGVYIIIFVHNNVTEDSRATYITKSVQAHPRLYVMGDRERGRENGFIVLQKKLR